MDMKIKRGQILKELRLNKKLSQQDIADILEVSARAYQKYEYGTAEPNFDNLSKLADFYGVSTDYLLGRELPPSSTDTLKFIEINKKVADDDDEFMRLYSQLPYEAKQIFVNIMMILQKNATTEKPRQRHVERLGDIEDRLKQEQEEEAKRKGVI